MGECVAAEARVRRQSQYPEFVVSTGALRSGETCGFLLAILPYNQWPGAPHLARFLRDVGFHFSIPETFTI
jgi:hypothetical protein